MPDLRISVEKATPTPFSVVPMLDFGLHVVDVEQPPFSIQSIALRCQIRIEPARRRYESSEKERLLDLFGDPTRWSQTCRPMLWTHASTIVPSFTGETRVDLPVPCTFDFNVAATKYFYSLEDGEVPLCLLFSGTVFYELPEQGLQAAPISWNVESTFRLPVQTWKEMMDIHYPNSAWLCLGRDTFDRLYRYKQSNAFATWERAIDSLLAREPQEVSL